MENQKMKWIISLSFRQIFYLLIGIALLVYALIEKDLIAGIFSIFCFVQGVFNICLFGTCRMPQKKR